MDTKKIVMYFAIAIVAFLLWNTWKTENTPKSPTNTSVVAAQSATIDNVNAPALSASTAVNKQLIHVKTDVLDVAIDPVGGTIMNASLLKYAQTQQDKAPVVLLNDQSDSLYVSESGVTDATGQNIPLTYHAAKQDYTLEPNQSTISLNLSAQNKGIVVNKTFIFTRDQYAITTQTTLKNENKTPWMGHVYNQITRKKVANTSQGILSYSTFIGAALSSPAAHYTKYSFSDLSANDAISQTIKGGWVAMIQHYFISAWVPDATLDYHYYNKDQGNQIYTVGLLSPAVTLAPTQTQTLSSQFYVGPTVSSSLEAVSPYLKLTVDYGWLWFISVIIFWIMAKVNVVLNNWGWSIVVTTIIIKLIFYKLSATSYRSMAKMRKLQPKIQALKERLGDDRQKLGAATMELYKKEKVNPLGGCLPIVIQIPVFLALYYVLIESVALRQAPFMLWIHNLSQPDPFFILPILMGISMFIQQKLSPPPPDPTQAKVMLFLPLIFTVFFLYFPAGLVLYWLVNNVVSIAQQYYITRQVEKGIEPKRLKKKDGRR